jgi:excisionase family DNA binding protein
MLTVPEAARRAGRSPETIRRWIWSGRLPSEKVGNQHLVDAEALDSIVTPSRPPRALDREPLPAVGGEWGDWLRRLETFHGELRRKGLRFPPSADLLAESRSRR